MRPLELITPPLHGRHRPQRNRRSDHVRRLSGRSSGSSRARVSGRDVEATTPITPYPSRVQQHLDAETDRIRRGSNNGSNLYWAANHYKTHIQILDIGGPWRSQSDEVTAGTLLSYYRIRNQTTIHPRASSSTAPTVRLAKILTDHGPKYWGIHHNHLIALPGDNTTAVLNFLNYKSHRMTDLYYISADYTLHSTSPDTVEASHVDARSRMAQDFQRYACGPLLQQVRPLLRHHSPDHLSYLNSIGGQIAEIAAKALPSFGMNKWFAPVASLVGNKHLIRALNSAFINTIHTATETVHFWRSGQDINTFCKAMLERANGYHFQIDPGFAQQLRGSLTVVNDIMISVLIGAGFGIGGGITAVIDKKAQEHLPQSDPRYIWGAQPAIGMATTTTLGSGLAGLLVGTYKYALTKTGVVYTVEDPQAILARIDQILNRLAQGDTPENIVPSRCRAVMNSLPTFFKRSIIKTSSFIATGYAADAAIKGFNDGNLSFGKTFAKGLVHTCIQIGGWWLVQGECERVVNAVSRYVKSGRQR